MHWLLRDENTFRALQDAGYGYDSTVGYNETVGYRAGTGQVFRPLTSETLLELPLHIQDGALFYPQRLDLTDAEARTRCRPIVDHAAAAGGVVTVLWHDRSHAAERFWGDFYLELIEALRRCGARFASGRQTVGWFQHRRNVRFDAAESRDGVVRATACTGGEAIDPPLTVRVHRPGTGWTDRSWDGLAPMEIELPASMCALS
jgi:hypothetical protein